jgi:hypothetical protein
MHASFDWKGLLFAGKLIAVGLIALLSAYFGWAYAERSYASEQDAEPVLAMPTRSPTALAPLVFSTTTPPRIIESLTPADVVPAQGKFILADLDAMRITLFQDGVATTSFPIKTKGRPGTAWETPAGFYAIQTKEENHFSTIGKVNMPYSMQFYGNYFIHGWTTYLDGTPTPFTFSGGCIKLDTPDAAQVFAFADLGTKLFVYDPPHDTPATPLALGAIPIPHVDADSYLVADMDTGDVYAEDGSREQRPIASITKLMTALVANETISFDKRLTVAEGYLTNPRKPDDLRPKQFVVGICNSHIIEQLALLRGESVETTGGWSVDATEPVSKSDMLLYPTTYWQYAGVPEITQRLMRRPYHPTKWGLAMTIPTEISYIPVKNLILMSMWEGGKIPDGWGELLRKYVKHLIVPSITQKEVFAKEFNGEISVVPLGVDTDTFAYQERPQRGEDEPFTILLYGSPLTSRKSPIETVVDVCYRAFGGEFGDPIDNWKIILKTRQGIVGAGKFKVDFNDPHVEVISSYYTTQELAELCYKADVGIALSKFEGAGLIPAEQMSTGLPVILSNHSGLTELCDPMFNIPIDPAGETTQHHKS